MSSDPTRSLRNIFSRIKKATGASISRQQMQALGEEAVNLVVKRTRLGYGVPNQFGEKSKLRGLSGQYIKFRTQFKNLSSTTTSGRSNLTLTGQMLDSVRVITAQDGKVRFGPTGGRSDTPFTNAQVAYFQEQQGRIFNRISQLEYQQLLRFFRRNFGDLLQKSGLLR